LTVTIDQAAGQADPTGAATISFTVVFSQPVSDFGNGDVALSGTASASQEAISGGGTTYTVAVSGMTHSGTVIASVPAGVVVDAAGVANSGSTSSDNTITCVVPTRLVVTGPPPDRVTAGSGFGFAVTAEDDAGAVAAGFSGSVTVALGSHPGGATLGGTLTAPLVNGVATFTGLTLDRANSAYTLQASYTGLTAATVGPFAVAPGPATQLVVTVPPPGSITAGLGFGLTVSAEDAFGNVAPTFNDGVTLALGVNPGGSTFAPVTATANQGVAAFTGLTLDKAGDGYTLQATADHLNSATSNPFDVVAGAATKLVVTGPPPESITAGTPFGLTVSAEDDQGNVDPKFSGSVKLVLSNNPDGSAFGTLTLTAGQGVAAFTGLTLNKAGDGYTLQASSNGLTATTTDPVTVLPGAATQLVVSVPPPGSITAGTPFGLTVSAEDAFGNVAPTFSGGVTLALRDNPGGSTFAPVTATANQGVAAFTGLTLNKAAGGYTLQASGNGPSPVTTDPFAVAAGAATQLVVSGPPPGSITAGTGFGLAVSAEDGLGNVDTTFTGSVSLALAANPGGATLGGAVTVTAAKGVAPFTGLTLNKPASGYTLRASSSNQSLSPITTDPFTVVPGAATHLVVLVQPPAVVGAGQGFGLVVQAEDALGNLDPTYQGSVTLGLTNNPGGSPLGGLLTVQAVHGLATFSGLTLSSAATGYVLQATAAGLAAATTDPLTVPVRPIAARLVPVIAKVGRKKVTRLMLVVFYEDTGAMKTEFAAPFQGKAYKHVQVSVRGNQVVVTARKGKKTVTATFST
jgi:hypothetical protein